MSRYIGVQMLEFAQKGDERGHLVIVEGMKDIPFNVAGKSKVRVKDGKGNEAVFCLNRPHTGLYIPPMIWKDMYDFSEDSVLLCIASSNYCPEEYIRDYDEFLRVIQEEYSGINGQSTQGRK